MIQKILIANRGEIAVRVIYACREMGVATVAITSDADTHAPHTRLADEVVHIGEPLAYLDIHTVIEAAHTTNCDAVHPGYGFLSESPDFAEAVREASLIFIGPPAQAIRAMGVKTEARAIMQAAGVPVVPGFQSREASEAAFAEAAQDIGYPVMVKAAGGGGGKGIRIVHTPDALSEAIASARREAQNAFGDSTVFLEKYIEAGRHIEVQVIADQHGNTVHLFERECSVQRRHQKIIEESPSPLLTSDIREEIGQAAVAAAEAVDYVNAGTIEFITEEDGTFYFLEMNTRLQVEHPVTEMVTGIDLVKEQIRVAQGLPLSFTQGNLAQRGHAIECRIYAEDPANGFLPAIGPILALTWPDGPGVRVDSGIAAGGEVTIHYDPMLAKLIVHAATREEAIRRMDDALKQTAVLGVTTNIPFLRDVLAHPTFIEGQATTRFVDNTFMPWVPEPQPPAVEALIALALSELAPQQESGEGDTDADRFSPWARTDSFRVGE